MGSHAVDARREDARPRRADATGSAGDLGSGDGVLVIAAARRGARARGIEYDRGLVAYAKRNAEEAGVGRLTKFDRADIFKSDFSDSTVVTTFLLPSMNLRLRPTLLAMKPGTRIVANTFSIAEWEPDATAAIEPCERWCTALLWIVPARVAGTWTTPRGELTADAAHSHHSRHKRHLHRHGATGARAVMRLNAGAGAPISLNRSVPRLGDTSYGRPPTVDLDSRAGEA